MPAPSDTQISQALLQSLKDGTYPESEDIVSADLAASAFSTELQFIQDARDEVKVCYDMLQGIATAHISDPISTERYTTPE